MMTIGNRGAGALVLAAVLALSPGAALAQKVVDAVGNPTGFGRWIVDDDGVVTATGFATDLGGLPPSTSPYVAAAASPNGQGLWGIREDGVVVGIGIVPDLAAFPEDPCAIVGVAATPSGQGLWALRDDGTVQVTGDAKFFGEPDILEDGQYADIVPTNSGQGYHLVKTDGTVVPFGDAVNLAAFPSDPCAIVGVAATPSGQGLWALRDDGTVQVTGDAESFGEVTDGLPDTFIGLVGLVNGRGYRLVDDLAQEFSFGQPDPGKPVMVGEPPK